MNTMQAHELPAPPEHYTRTAVALHWTIAGLIICGFTLGWVMTELAISPLKLRMYNWHKWVGITVLGLAAVRGIWRLAHTAPALLPMPVWQRISAHGLHGLLYVFMFLQPLSGWAYSNAVGYPIVYLSLIPLPNLVSKDKALAHTLLEVHETVAWILAVALALHALAALKHHFMDRDGTLKRMLSWRSPRKRTVAH